MIQDVHPIWPRHWPLCRFAGLLLAFACGLLWIRLWLQFASPLERFYFPTYVKGALFSDLPSLHLHPRTRQLLSDFQVVFLGRYIATDELLARPPGALSVRTVQLRPKGFHSWLQEHIYRQQTLAQTLRWPLAGFGVCVVLFVAVGAYLDNTHNRKARNGRRLRGPALTSRWGFNRRTKGDGLRFRTDNWQNPLEWLQTSEAGRCLRIRRDREAHHIQIAGDTGSGKSTLVREVLFQVEARGEIAIVFDPDREYIQEFFSEERGDWVLNPKDERCPYWPIGAEAEDEAEATPIAPGFFPDEPTLQKFFLTHTRAIFAYLLAAYGPTR